MRAPDVWLAMASAMSADPVIQAEIGAGAIYLTDGDREYEVPSLTGFLTTATQEERFILAAWQIDVFARSLDSAVAVGEALLRIFDHDVRKTIGGLRMWARCTEEREFHGPVADGVYRRSLDIETEVIRRRYVRTGAES